MKSRILVIFSILLIATFVISACAPVVKEAQVDETTAVVEESKTTATEESAALPQEENMPFKGHTLVVWIGSHAVEQEPIWNKWVSDFEEMTGADVELSLLGFEGYYDKLVSAYAAGSPPDIALGDMGGWVPAFAAKDWIIPLDDQIDAWEGKDQIFDNLWVTVTYDGIKYGLPWDADSRFLVYNKQMFRDADLDPEKPPETWDDLLEYAQAINDPENGVYGYGVSGAMSELATLGYMMFLGGNGGRLLTDDFSEAAFNTPEGLEALKFYTDLYKVYEVSPPGTANQGEDEYRNAMAAGKMGMAVGGNWSWPLLYLANPDMKGEVGTAIHPYNKEPYSVLGGWASMISKESKEQELAWEWISYYTSKDAWLYWLSQSEGPMPVRKDITEESPLFQDELWKVQLATFPYADARPPIPEYPEISYEIQLMVQSVLTDQATPEEAIQTAAEKVNAILGK